jgi:hypothetical protein
LTLTDESKLDEEVVVVVRLPYSTVGGRPNVKVKYVGSGFDWDSGKFEIITEEELQPADRDFGEKFRKVVDDLGWAQYENRNLKAEVKKLRKQLSEKNNE